MKYTENASHFLRDVNCIAHFLRKCLTNNELQFKKLQLMSPSGNAVVNRWKQTFNLILFSNSDEMDLHQLKIYSAFSFFRN